MIPLAYVREGSIVRVKAIRAGRGLARRLHELGVVEGRLLRVVKSQGPGSVIVEVANGQTLGGRLLLGFGVALKVIVEEVTHYG